MAGDAVALLDVLDVADAHVVGVSMGGMIAQSIAIHHPHRVRTLVSIMSTTGHHAVGQPRPGIVELMIGPVASTKEEAIDSGLVLTRAVSSPGYPFDEAEARERSGRAFDRGFHPEGVGRHLVAILASGDRTAALGAVEAPTLVLHGEADPLVEVSGGRATAAAIPGAELVIVPGMGHDLPAALRDDFAERIARHARAHDRRAAASTPGAPS